MKQRLEYIQIDEATRASLKDISSHLVSHLPGVLDEFYVHIQDYPQLTAMFGGADRMQHAKEMQVLHWQRILKGEFGAEYIDSVTKIGNRHNRIGLEPQWYLGGYSFIAVRLLESLIFDTLDGPFSSRKRKELAAGVAAFVKALLLDTDIAITTYLDAAKKDRQQTMQSLSQDFDTDVHAIVKDVLSSSENASANVQTVAAATEQLAASISEISNQILHTEASARETSAIVEQASLQVTRLSEAANKIGQVVDMIGGIAERTNLLALNATIEAARAGEAGKGFAVVAAEVKNLAGKTAEATKEIIAQIATIQTETKQTVEGIEAIVSKIANVQERSSSVAIAVEQQQAATAEISRSVHQVSAGTQQTTSQTRDLKSRVDGFLEILNQDNPTARKKEDRPATYA